MTNLSKYVFGASALLLMGIAHAASVTEITLPGTRIFPESITSTKNGTLIVGSLGHGNVMRIIPGSSTAEEWIKPGANGLGDVLGVYADEKGKTLWVCSNDFDKKGKTIALIAFDLSSGASKGSYPIPGPTGFCNDTAVSSDGTPYVADTTQGTIWMLKPGAKTLESAAKDPLLAGADGLAFGDKNILYVNSFTTGKLVRVDLGADGKSTKVTDLTLSRKLERPDGMRTIGKNRMLLAENTGKMSIVTVAGDSATITVIKEGLESTPAVTATRGMAWVAEGKLNYRGDANKDPGAFKMFAVPLPKN